MSYKASQIIFGKYHIHVDKTKYYMVLTTTTEYYFSTNFKRTKERFPSLIIHPFLQNVLFCFTEVDTSC